MKILKIILFSIICTIFFMGQLKAQINEEAVQMLEPLNSESLNNIKPGFCSKKIPPLEIYSINGNNIKFNRIDYLSFDYAKLTVSIEKDCEKENKDPDCLPNSKIIIINSGEWEVVPEPGNTAPNGIFRTKKPTSCEDYVFQIVANCSKDTLYSNKFTYNFNDNCSNTNKKSNNSHTINVFPQPTSNYIFVRNEENEQFLNLSIFNLQGNKLSENKINNSTSILKIDLPLLKYGIYIFKFEIEGGKTYYKKIHYGSD